jgi:hypothetical protein
VPRSRPPLNGSIVGRTMTENVDSTVPEPEPPSPAKVARRAIVLATVSCRGILELDPARDEATRFWTRVSEWWSRLGLSAELEPSEAALLAAAFGTSSQQDLVDASWRSEALSVLAWALQRGGLPSHDEQVDPAVVASALGFLEDHTALESPALRPAADLENYSNVALTIHWRLRDFSLNARALDFAKFCETAWFGPLSLDGVRLVEGDLAIGKLPISRAAEHDIRKVMSVAQERHQAANWLLDASSPFSETDTST